MKNKLLLGIIIFAAFLLRVLYLDVIPYGFTPDEASFGYDAYSLILTGKDQWGHTLPLVLESFGDFKMPLYSYIAAPFIYLLGLSKFAIRLPNALLGTAAVYVTFLLVQELFKELRIRKFKNSLARGNWSLGIIAGLLLAVNPWHIMMSRGAFEANLTTLLMPLAVYFFLRGLKEKSYMSLSALTFGFNLFSYHSARLVTPLLVFILILIYKNEILDGVKKISVAEIVNKYKYSLLIFVAFISTAFYTLALGAGSRAKDISIFSGALEEASQERFIAIYQGMSLTAARLFHNKFLVSTDRFLSNYFQYISPNFLFINGPAEATYGMLPGRGVVYWIELIFLAGFLYSGNALKNRKAFLFILIWILLSPLPAALTTGRGFAGNRAVIMQPAISIASAMGLFALYFYLRKLNKSLSLISVSAVAITLLLMFTGFLKEYFLISPYKVSKEMLYGNLEVAEWLSKNAENKNIIVSKSLSEPHIYIAFAQKWNPTDYQKHTFEWGKYREKKLLFVDMLDEYKLGNYTFKSIDYSQIDKSDDVLLVGRPGDFAPEVSPKIKFIHPNGEASIYVVEPFQEAYAGKAF